MLYITELRKEIPALTGEAQTFLGNLNQHQRWTEPEENRTNPGKPEHALGP